MGKRLERCCKWVDLFVQVGNQINAVKILAYIAINITGAIFAVGFFSDIFYSIEIERQNCCNSGDIISFIFRIGPVFLICVFLNILWIIKVGIDFLKHKNYQSLLAFGFVMIIWIISFLIIRFDILL